MKAALTPASAFPGVGVAVKAGDILNVLAWSNAAFTVRGIANFRSIQGDAPTSLIVDVVVTSNRTLSTANAVIPQDGVIDACAFDTFNGTTPTQRGQCFIAMWMTRGGMTAAYAALTQGYFYIGSILMLGFYEEPGPAGGHGAFTRASGTNPVAGVLPTDGLPTGAIWRLRSYQAALVTDATVGNRQFALVIDDGATASRIFIAQNNNNQAATLTRTWAWYLGTDLSTSVGAALTDTQVILPAYNLKNDLLIGLNTQGGQPNFRLVSTGALAFTATDDFAAPALEVEEWVMPN